MKWKNPNRGCCASLSQDGVSLRHNDNYNSYVVVTVTNKDNKEYIIGIESQGDPYSNQKAWIKKCIAAD